MVKQITRGKDIARNTYWSAVGMTAATMLAVQPVFADTIWDRFSTILNAIFDVIARLNGVGQFFVIGTGVLHTLEFGAVQSDTLGNFVDGFAPILPGEVDININALTGIDEAGHPTAPHGTGIPVPLDIEEAVISAIHDDVVVMG